MDRSRNRVLQKVGHRTAEAPEGQAVTAWAQEYATGVYGGGEQHGLSPLQAK